MGFVKDFIFSTILILFKGNRDFFKLIDDFQDLLPPKHKRANEDAELMEVFSVINTSKMEMNITTKEIDLFHKKLENFKYHLIFIKRNEIISYSNNLQRLLRTSGWEKFGVALVQKILDDEFRIKPYVFGEKVGRYIGF